MNQLSSILFHVHLESLDFSLAFSFRTQIEPRLQASPQGKFQLGAFQITHASQSKELKLVGSKSEVNHKLS